MCIQATAAFNLANVHFYDRLVTKPGEFSTVKGLDRESQGNNYTVRLIATNDDLGSSTLKGSRELLIEIRDINDHVPVFEDFPDIPVDVPEVSHLSPTIRGGVL